MKKKILLETRPACSQTRQFSIDKFDEVFANQQRHTADLTSYASLIGESFSSKVNLLTQILKGAHYPSIGRYKEKLLAKLISEYIPKTFEVGTGFVLFPVEKKFKNKPPNGFDPLNMSAHIISKQCDILVYDAGSVPVIFKDDDFVVLRPEAVKAVIEVKGSLNPKEVGSSLKGLLDFGRKWRECQKFYKAHSQPIVPRPPMFIMAWDITRRKGMPVTNGKKLRKQICTFYKKNLNTNEFSGMPILEKLFVYNECEIMRYVVIDKIHDKYIFKMAWATKTGKFIRANERGEIYEGSDKTIASLLADIHYHLGTEFNRFFSYMDEIRGTEVDRIYEHDGYDIWFENDELMTAILSKTPAS